MRSNLIGGILFIGALAACLSTFAVTIFDVQSNKSPAATQPAGSPTTSPTASDQSAAATRIPVPTKADVSKATKMVDELYLDDFAKALSADQKSDLANKLLQDGIDEKSNMAGKFVLFRRAIDEATSGVDLITAASAVAKMSAVFQVDPAKLTRNAAAATSAKLTTDAERRNFAGQAESLAGDAQADDEFELAKYLDGLASAAARNAGDAALVAQMTSISAQHAEMAEAYTRVIPAEKTLKTKPEDAHANLEVGKYLCFYAGKWDRGLPLLSKGSDSALKALAHADLKRSADPHDEVVVGDGWWDTALALDQEAKRNCQNRAAAFYQRALPAVTGLSKARVEKRLALLDSEPLPGTVNLLNLVNVRTDSTWGEWTMSDGKLMSDGGDCSRIEFRYEPPADYDYEVEFVRTSGNDCVDLIATAGENQFTFSLAAMNNTAYGFSYGPTGHSPSVLTNGRKYSLVLKVRDETVSAYLDGKLFDHVSARVVRPDANSGLHHKTTLGVMTYRSPTLFYAANVTPVTGRGHVIAVGAGSGDKQEK